MNTDNTTPTTTTDTTNATNTTINNTPPVSSKISPFWQQKYRKDLGKNWNLFYKRNETRFFRDRHWISQEFPELLTGPWRVFEVGCGVGNFLYPLLELNGDLRAVGCDISERAVELFKENENFKEDRMEAFVADIIKDDLSERVGVDFIDFASCIFVLSALPPESLLQSVKNVWKTLRPGGEWFIRDYAANDAAQSRFDPSQSQLDENLFVRQDGTLAHYFNIKDLIEIFETDRMFQVKECKELQSKTTNIKKGIDLERKFIQIKLIKL